MQIFRSPVAWHMVVDVDHIATALIGNETTDSSIWLICNFHAISDYLSYMTVRYMKNSALSDSLLTYRGNRTIQYYGKIFIDHKNYDKLPHNHSICVHTMHCTRRKIREIMLEQNSNQLIWRSSTHFSNASHSSIEAPRLKRQYSLVCFTAYHSTWTTIFQINNNLFNGIYHNLDQ